MSQVLLVEDQVNVRRSMALLLEQDGHTVIEAATVAEALRLASSTRVDVVVSDVRIENGDDGVALLRELRAQEREIEVVMITAFGTIADAVEAIKAGAYDYLTKPADPDRLLLTVRRAAERTALAREVRQLRAQVDDHDRIVAASREMQRVLATVAQLSTTDSTVLISGESGTGKELVARALWSQSGRRQRRFVPINCGAIPEALLESELFGHRKGAFTGATGDKKGLLEEADGGVLFLDEIGEMPQTMQVRLLRFLQGGEVRRIGDTAPHRVDVRLVAATHRDLAQEVAEGRFRADFFYRINVVEIRIPPLRERVDDIPALADFFLRRYSARLRRRIEGFTPEALDLLRAHPWPGNAREMENAIERAVNLASGTLLTEADLPASVAVQARTVSAAGTATPADERSRLIAALEHARWNQSRAAEHLGMSRTTLWRKMREHRIEA
ncbi:MAG TPA: sigma-54 dependent transcriptional regulator [Vicinamibacterales bacterium]|nr:sigma-54 dependent transcriptional regulator [Vicinamibacterales bacterium]